MMMMIMIMMMVVVVVGMSMINIYTYAGHCSTFNILSTRPSGMTVGEDDTRSWMSSHIPNQLHDRIDLVALRTAVAERRSSALPERLACIAIVRSVATQ
jgi:hypothetical protein